MTIGDDRGKSPKQNYRTKDTLKWYHQRRRWPTDKPNTKQKLVSTWLFCCVVFVCLLVYRCSRLIALLGFALLSYAMFFTVAETIGFSRSGVGCLPCLLSSKIAFESKQRGRFSLSRAGPVGV